MRKVVHLLILLLAFNASLAVAKTDNYEMMVSTVGYNRLMFPVPYSQIVLPPDAQLSEDPVSLQGNYGLLIKPAQGARPITVFVQLIDGRAFNVNLIPSSKPEGAVFRFAQADDTQVKPASVNRPDDGWIADVFVQAFQNKTPTGFEIRSDNLLPIKAILAPKTGDKKPADQLNQLDLMPVAMFDGSGYRVRVYRLASNNVINIEPRDLYNESVVALAIDGDVVSQQHNPTLVVLEAKDE
ncbi:hypothetical protein [Marinospirillum insulare]|uniref:TraK protein n=1 Tax=Marinospirillum insulare TaxID=217169 RepID=A0ABQ5ZY47_9GAMM|nr:hypothetical protein [Marinospirillum insulare]GLR65094.1 hypothetical protein GCM10007878_25330 [Marinospirillum insulare]